MKKQLRFFSELILHEKKIHVTIFEVSKVKNSCNPTNTKLKHNIFT